MKRLLTPIIFILLMACQTTNNVDSNESTTPNRNDINELSRIYDIYNLEYKIQRGNIVVEYSVINVEKLLKIHTLLIFKMKISRTNTANATSTGTTIGSYYRKQIVVIDEYGEFYSKEIENLPKLLYKPEHPNAYTDGELAGYVEYPNIDIKSEMEDLKLSSSLYSLNIEILRVIDSELASRIENQQQEH